ncbi:peptidoglycan-binding domain-containing protein [Streptomyces sp. NPDC046942]|uniref:peptidoglycan-binding domain-containing protein n=1 Tax=Streptomyces sp. NPDC046942 TaxID=3155137 RepID=UPI0033F03D63
MRKKIAAVAAGLVMFTGAGLATATTASAAVSGGVCGNYSTSEPTLSYGASGDAVKALQCELNWDMNNTSLTIDGQWGDNTQAAVLKFQGCAGLQKDGIVGPQTWSKLDYWAASQYYVC